MGTHADETFDVVVIGGGQAGLSVGHHLRNQGLRFVILDAGERIGDAWRKRWDSLRVFSPAKFDGLDGMPFPAPPESFPTKDEMADYLEAYAARFELPVRTGVRVQRASQTTDGFLVETNRGWFQARQLVVAMANWQGPRVPDFASDLDPNIVQLHSSAYRNPSQLREGGVLIVGVGNSGSEIAVEAAQTHATWASGPDVGEVPFDIHGFLARKFVWRFMLRFMFHHVLTIHTPMGRSMRKKMLSHGAPLMRIKQAHLRAAGVERVGRTVGVRDGRPILDDGRVLDVANVVWCTGYQKGLSWLDVPVWADGDLRHHSGVADEVPGLYFVGQMFMHAASSAMIHGVGRDAARISRAVVARAAVAKREAARADAARTASTVRARATDGSRGTAPAAPV